MTINEIQDEVIEEFAGLDDWMDRYQLLIDLGTYTCAQRTLSKGYYGCRPVLHRENRTTRTPLAHPFQRTAGDAETDEGVCSSI